MDRNNHYNSFTNLVLGQALYYSDKFKFSVIPIKPDKNSYQPWSCNQKKKAPAEEIRGSWNRGPNAMIGIVMGRISGIFVIDCDTEADYEAVQKLNPESLIIPVARTPTGGWHLYFLFPEYSMRSKPL